MAFVMALALSLAAFTAQAKAATIAIGPFSSGSGSVPLSGLVVSGFDLPFTINAFSFTLTDNANVSGNFAYSGVLLTSISIDLNSGPLNLAHTTATELSINPFGNPILVPAQPGLFSLDLTPGNYQLVFSGDGIGSVSGTLAFAPVVATTPIPAALPLFASALGGLGFVGWRRKMRRAAQGAA